VAVPIDPLTPAAGAGDMFLFVKGARAGVIKGEAQDTAHQDEIDVISWSWGMQATRHQVTGAAAGKTSIQELKIVKRVDSASTGLMSALRTNESIKEAKLTLRKSGKGQLEYLKIIIENGRVVSLTLDGGTPPGSAQVLEHVAFAFNKITVEYVPQGKDGQGKGGMQFLDEYENAQ
jgi:type VI secretion system secreted protein Hcp